MSPVDIVIVNYNTRVELAACLASIAASPPRHLGTIFVVDNSSQDGSVAAVRTRWPLVQVIALDRNVGFGAANNVAIRASSAARILLLNSDTIVPPGALDRLVERFDATGAVVAGPRLTTSEGRPEVSFGAMLSPASELRQAIRQRLARGDSAMARAYAERLVSKERFVDWVTGACLLVDRAAAIAVGLFDERYFMYEEDVDLCAALRARGGRVLFTPHATVIHHRGRSGGGSRVHYDRSHLAFYEKHAPGWVPLLRATLRLRGRTIE